MGVAFTSASDATFRAVPQDRAGVASAATQLAGALGSAMVAGVNGALINLADRNGRAPATGIRWAFAFDLVLVAMTYGASARLRVAAATTPAAARS